MMRGILEQIGYEVSTTDNPEQALTMVRSNVFDLVFIDLIMPDVDGTDLCEQIRQVLPEAGIYAYSGHAHLYRFDQLKRAGFTGTINKPATIQEIRNAIGLTADA